MPDPEAFHGLRELAFNMRADAVGVNETWPPESPYGVIMDWGVERGVATLTSFTSGDASLYLSTGGGVIGGFAHTAVREAAQNLVGLAASFVGQTNPAPDHPTPAFGQVFFHLITPQGLRRAEASEEDLAEGSDPLAPLFMAGHEVITQLRTIVQSREDG
jgi:hypothetical protein